MAQKTLQELLNKFLPSDEQAAILSSGLVTKSRIDKEKRILEVCADFPYLIDKEELYALEAQIAEVYHLSAFKILPHYPTELFSEHYISAFAGNRACRCGCKRIF